MPKRRVLPFIILGIIESHRNLTGKEITQEFTTEIGDFWKASHSQIYPELKRMLADGWIQMNVDSNNAKEKFYTITSKGANVLSNWLDISVDSLPIHEDLFSLKLFFINKQNDPRIKKLFTRQIELLSESLLYLKSREKNLFSTQNQIDQNYGHYLILSRAISRTEGQLKWLKENAPK